MFSPTVMSGNRLWFCGTWTTPARRISRGLLPVSRSPRCSTWPLLGRRMPLMTDSNVDLPAPFGPTMQVMPPAGTVKDTSWSTSPPPYPAVTPSTTSAASVIVVIVTAPEVGVEHPRVGPDCLRRAGCHNRAGVEHRDLVAQGHDEVHVVLDEKKSLARLVHLADAVGDVVDERGVDAAGGFVEQHHGRVSYQHIREFQQLALAIRQRPGELARMTCD